ncbi:MAG TPA: molybdopterin molybdotransferase MoeA [Burkholderiaceae bacterium]|jgi:molybdopterin molybdotransferase
MEPDSLANITTTLRDYKPELLPLSQASEFIERLLLPPREREVVHLSRALGRVLSCDVVAGVPLPLYDTAGVEGYALRGEELELDAPTRFVIADPSWAGDAQGALLPLRHCLRIGQGEPLPRGFDTVAPFNALSDEGDSIVIPAQVVHAGDFRRVAGHDMPLGGVAIPAGRQLRAVELALLASLRIEKISVWRKLRVGVIATGKNPQANRCALQALLHRLGFELVDLGAVEMEVDTLFDAFRHGARRADAIVCAGGLEYGDLDDASDLMQRVLADLGQVQHWNLALSPGGRMAVGRIGDFTAPALLFALPDDPAAMISTFYALVREALLRMSGTTPGRLPMVRARCLNSLRKPRGRTEYKSGTVRREGRCWVVEATTAPGASTLGSMSNANGVIVLVHDQGDVRAGDFVSVLPFDGLA